MKELDGKLYGYSYELDADPTVDDLTEFRAVDNGRLYIALNGRWYVQPTSWRQLDNGGGGGGGGGGRLMVNVTTEGGISTLDKTWKEIRDAFVSGATVILNDINADTYNTYMQIISVTHRVSAGNYVVTDGLDTDYVTNTENGYPSAGD